MASRQRRPKVTSIDYNEENIYNTRGSSETSFASTTYTDTHKFRDNRRQIDLVLVYKNDNNVIHADQRTEFQKNIRFEGLQLEEEYSCLPYSDLVFLKVHGTYHVLAAWAEQHEMKVVYKEEEDDPNQSLDKHFGLGSGMTFNIEGRRMLKAVFREEDIEWRCQEDDEVFSSAERTQIVHNILLSVRYGGAPTEVGLVRLLAAGAYLDAYPLHSGGYHIPDGVSDQQLSERQMLCKWWASVGMIGKRQPLDQVGKYFGDEVALYFAWLGTYTRMLVPATVIGLIATAYMIFVGIYYHPFEEVCKSQYTSSMLKCPRCHQDYCQNYPVFANHSCTTAKVTYIFSNYGTSFTAVCMAFWATAFMEVWKRKKAILIWRWDLKNELEHNSRPQYESQVKHMRFNPVYNKMEPHLPFWNRIIRQSISAMGLLLMMVVVAVGIAAVIYYKLSIVNAILLQESKIPHQHTTYLERHALMISYVTGAFMNLFLMAIFQKIFNPLFFDLTDLEMPRTNSEYEASYSLKIFAFSFFNHYALLFYIAFFKGQFFTFPGDRSMYWDAGGIGISQCNLLGCVYELVIQLSVFVFGEVVMSIFTVVILPMVRVEWRRRKHAAALSTTGGVLPRWEEDYYLEPASCFHLYQRMLGNVTQYGFITLFVPVVPLLPALALLHNVFEIRVVARQMLVQQRRPVPRNVRGLTPWARYISFLSYLAVLTNGLVIAVTSDIIPRNIYEFDNGNIDHYINSTISLYPLLPDYKFLKDLVDRIEPNNSYNYCWYRGRRWPPWHPDQYRHTYQHWRIQAYRLGFLLLFVCLEFAFMALLAFLIPHIPWEVRDRMTYERQEALSAKKAIIQGARYKKRKTVEIPSAT